MERGEVRRERWRETRAMCTGQEKWEEVGGGEEAAVS